MLFPALKDKKFGYINLNLEAAKWIATRKDLAEDKNKNPLLNPAVCQVMVDDLHKKYHLDFSFGGWMEDRSFLWKDSYLQEWNTFIHLGIDFNVPFGTEVAADFNAQVIKIDSDYPEEGGWGTKIILKHALAPVYMIYAHLDKNVFVHEGQEITKGTLLAKVGKAPYNGNWFSHLHVQTISENYYQELEKNNTWAELDGYGSKDDIAVNAERFVDPMNYIRLLD